jgi:hypothetical protein
MAQVTRTLRSADNAAGTTGVNITPLDASLTPAGR